MKKPEKKKCIAYKPHYKCGSNMGLCSECYRNQAIDDYEKFLPSKEEIKDIIYNKVKDKETKAVNSWYEWLGKSLAKALNKRLRGEEC